MLDFDAFRNEHRADTREAPSIKVGGKVYNLPPSLPALVALDILRARRELGDDAEFPPELINDVCDALFGREEFHDLLVDTQLSVDELADMITQIMKMYEPDNGNDVPNREARRNVKRSRSSTTGRTSRQISSGNTTSTSRRT